MKRLLAAVCAGLAVSILVPNGLAQAAPASSGTVKSIVFESQDNQIWLVKGDGTGLHKIAAKAGTEQDEPSFSPSGKQIVFVQGGDLWVVNAAGGPARQLSHTGSAGQPAWSPDGKWIAFVERVNNTTNDDIFRIHATGGAVARLTYGAKQGCDAFAPAWSPDGTSIAYERPDNGNPMCTDIGLVVQKIGHAGSVVVPGTITDPSFTPAGNLVYRALCPDVCGDQWVGYESAADGTNPQIVVEADGCMAGDLCLEDMVGAPAGDRGWIANESAYDENDPISDATTCFYGAYQKNGAVTQTTPNFCLGGLLAQGFDAA